MFDVVVGLGLDLGLNVGCMCKFNGVYRCKIGVRDRVQR